MGAAGGAGLAGAGALVYQAAPSFWQQYASEMKRPIDPPRRTPDPLLWPDKGLHAAWLGHSTVLLKIDGFTIITDPIFSDRAGIHLGPITLGIKRLIAPALDLNALPRIDLVLVSHAHMDHLDTTSLARLGSKQTALITARETSDLIPARRYKHVAELSWGGSTRVGPALVQGIEVNHWGARMRSDTYRGYNGYTIEVGRHRVLFAGDTAITGAFRQVHSSRPFDLGVFPIGAYNPWRRYHCTPEEAWRMGNDAGVDVFLPVHHQTFSLSREPFLEPIERFRAAAGARQERIAASFIGDEWRLA